jgi:hypothetical protein
MITILLMAILPALQQAPASIDYSKIERKIVKEPKYVGKPQYALFLLDEAGDFRVWAVLDRFEAEMRLPNVLYLDLNGNGDLTEKGERFVSSRDGDSIEEQDPPSRWGRSVPGKDLKHGMSRSGAFMRGSTVSPYFRIKWAGREPMYGGFALSGYNNVRWGTTVAEAPIFHPNPYGPLSFALWGEPVLQLGQESNVNLFAGNPGRAALATAW